MPSRRGISMVHQHFMLVPVLTVAENIVLGEETTGRGGLPRPQGGPPADRRARPAVRLRGRPGGQGRLAVGRLAAAGRDPQGALPRREDPRPRRADRGPHAAGDGGDLRGPAAPGGRGPQHRLHQPQAVRGPRDRGPDHGHPARQGRRPADPVRDERGGPRRADGRARGLADRRSRRVAPGRRRRSRSRASVVKRRPRQRGRPRRRPRGPGGRDPRHRRASPATARTSSSRRSSACASRPAGRSTLDGDGHHRPEVARRSTSTASATSRPTATGSGWCCRSRIADNLVLTSYHRPPYSRAASCATTPRSDDDRRGADQGVRHPDAVGRREGRRRCRAATSRRSSSRASSTATCSCSSSTSRRAASTSAASSSSTARRSPSATPARPSCSSPPSSTRSSSCPTGSRSSTAASSSACVDGRTADKNEVGLLMATGGREATTGRQRA